MIVVIAVYGYNLILRSGGLANELVLKSEYMSLMRFYLLWEVGAVLVIAHLLFWKTLIADDVYFTHCICMFVDDIRQVPATLLSK